MILAPTAITRRADRRALHIHAERQHGSWNRSKLSGYRVVFVPFVNGRPSGPLRDILAGFLAPNERDSYGRPVGVAVGPDHASLLIADDVGDVIWRVTGA